MPYISTERRADLSYHGSIPRTPGELNYSITNLIGWYMRAGKVDYAKINEVIGVLECAKLELYRRVAAPYEDKKMEENGDVY